MFVSHRDMVTYLSQQRQVRVGKRSLQTPMPDGCVYDQASYLEHSISENEARGRVT